MVTIQKKKKNMQANITMQKICQNGNDRYGTMELWSIYNNKSNNKNNSRKKSCVDNIQNNTWVTYHTPKWN